jgi:hypothetical protein
MLTNSFCGDSDSDSADWSNKTIAELPHHAPSHMLLREGARPEVVRGILGHVNIDVTQNQELGSTRGQSPKTNCGEWRRIVPLENLEMSERRRVIFLS